MNLIAAAARLWSDLTWWDLLLAGVIPLGVLILILWADRWLRQMEHDAAQKPSNSTVNMAEWYAKRRAEVEARKKNGDVA